MKPSNTAPRFATLMVALTSTALIPSQALANCTGSSVPFESEVVTYLEGYLADSYNRDQPPLDHVKDSRCTREKLNGIYVCHIRMRGVLHHQFGVTTGTLPLTQHPGIVVNHGSELDFVADTKGCDTANYFVPKGYVVFVPFRRGHGDQSDITRRSTGISYEDEVAHCHNDATCVNQAEVLRKQAKEDVIQGFHYLRNKPYVNDNAIAIMGASFGGRVTAFVNDKVYNLPHKAVAVFSAAAESWNTPDNPTPIQAALLIAVRNAKQPAFYLQPRWDYDTRPTVDLGYQHAYGGSDDLHSKPFMSAVYAYEKPSCATCFQEIHAKFAKDPDVWGPAVLDFFQRNGVK
jgi:dienelactone hydrolase